VAKLVSNSSLANYLHASELRIDQQSEAGNMDQAHLIACPALPTCSQAVSEAESYRAELLSIFESIENRLNLPLGNLQVRIAGCSNNCSRPLLAHIGLIGQGTDRYAIFFGGSIRKSTLAKHIEGTWPWGPKLFETLERLCLLVYQTSTSTECCSMNQFNLAECFESISEEQLELISSQLTKDL
jgi:sulfite reductase beta subunit-like hemoprotein